MKNIFLICCFCYSSIAFSQGITFTTEFKSNFNEWVIKVIEDDEGNYVCMGKIYSSIGTDNGKIIKLNAQGEIIDSLYMPADNAQSFLIPVDIIQVGNHYLCIASKKGKLFFFKLDKNFNILIQKELPLLSYGGNSFIDKSYLICDSDSNLIISGGIDSLIFNKRQPYLYKVSLNGDSIHAIYPQPIYAFSSFTEVIEQANDTTYRMFGKNFYNGGSVTAKMMLYDTAFNLLKTDTLYSKGSRWVVSPTQIEDTIFIALRTRVWYPMLLKSFDALAVLKISTNNDSLNLKVIEGGQDSMVTVPASFDAIDQHNNFIVTAGTMYYNDGNVHPYSGTGTGLVVAKTDVDLNTVWKRKIEVDSVRYTAYGIIATKDGGCLVYGTTYDVRAKDYQDNTFVIKLDELGNISWVKEEAIRQPIPIAIFPNPAKNYINYKISTDAVVQKIELVSITGQKVKTFLNPPTLLNIEGITQGTYLMRFFTDKGWATKKMVVE